MQVNSGVNESVIATLIYAPSMPGGLIASHCVITVVSGVAFLSTSDTVY